MTKNSNNGCWIMTYEVNDYNQHGVYFLAAFESKPTIEELTYYQIKEDPHGYDPALVGFAAYCCSYAGKFWGGYARGKNARGEWRNFASEQARNLEKQRCGIIGAKFTNLNYLEMGIEPGSTVYCDPPYMGTTGYQSGIDYAEFWNWCEELVLKGCRVFVSEYKAPLDWECVCGRRMLQIA